MSSLLCVCGISDFWNRYQPDAFDGKMTTEVLLVCSISYEMSHSHLNILLNRRRVSSLHRHAYTRGEVQTTKSKPLRMNLIIEELCGLMWWNTFAFLASQNFQSITSKVNRQTLGCICMHGGVSHGEYSCIGHPKQEGGCQSVAKLRRSEGTEEINEAWFLRWDRIEDIKELESIMCLWWRCTLAFRCPRNELAEDFGARGMR